MWPLKPTVAPKKATAANLPLPAAPKANKNLALIKRLPLPNYELVRAVFLLSKTGQELSRINRIGKKSC
jgi:hypothetical protein